jgi:hypothetical protein
MRTWLNQDYGDRGVVDILAVDAYFGVELCTPIFLGGASKLFLGSKSFLKKIQNSNGSGRNVYVIEKPS